MKKLEVKIFYSQLEAHRLSRQLKAWMSVNYLTTDTFFDLKELPKSMTIIGGGVISIELAFAMAPLGTKVTIIEVAPDILLTEDRRCEKNH